MTTAIESSMRQMLAGVLNAHYVEPDEPSHRAVWIDLTLDHIGDSADVELARSGLWSGTLAEWLEVGPGIVRRVPLVWVELVDRKPTWVKDEDTYGKEFAGKWTWWACIHFDTNPRGALFWSEIEYLPRKWFDQLPGGIPRIIYDTEELALADASQRAIAWARRTEVTP